MTGKGRESVKDDDQPIVETGITSDDSGKTENKVDSHPQDSNEDQTLRDSVNQQTGPVDDGVPDDQFDEVFAALEGEQNQVKAEKVEPIRFDSLPPEEQSRTLDLMVLQKQIEEMAEEFIPDKEARKKFLADLSKEQTVRTDAADLTLTRKPEFGPATRDGFQKLVEYLEDSGIKRRFMELNGLQLTDVPGLDLKWAEKNIGVPGSREGNQQKLDQGKGYLDIDPRNPSDVSKLADVTGWLKEVDQKIKDEKIERKTELFSEMLETGIKEGQYPTGWRRPPEMSKETWCAALEQTIGAHMRTTEIIEAINHVVRSDMGFKTDALKNLPPGITVEYDSNSRATKIKFGDYMLNDLVQQSAENKPKLAELEAWCDRYEPEAKTALEQWRVANLKPHDCAGYGETEIEDGWVNPKTNAFVMHSDSPGEGWEHFNLLTYDMTIDRELDSFGKVKNYIVTPDVRFQNVLPGPAGYLNLMKFGVHNPHAEKGEPKKYGPEDYVAVMTGPGNIEMIKAKNLETWRSMQELKLVGGKAIIFTMDAAMVASGGLTLAGKKVAQKGLQEAVKAGAKELGTKAMVTVPGDVLARQTAKGLVEIGLGLGGPMFHGAGSHDIPIMKTAGELRSYYFLAHGGYSLMQMTRLPEAVGALARQASPKMAAGAEGIINTIRGSAATREAMHLAHTGAFVKLGENWQAAERWTHRAFAGSEALFIGQFAWDSTSMFHEYQKNKRPWAFEQAQKALTRAEGHDMSFYQGLVDNRIKREEVLDIHMLDFKDAMGPLGETQSATIDGIIAKVKQLSADNVPQAERDKYVQELMKHFRYSGEAMTDMRKSAHADGIKLYEQIYKERASNDLSNDLVDGAEPYSEAQYVSKARQDNAALDPNVRKMAALATMILSRQPDGSWPDTLARREVTLPGYKLEVAVPPKVMEEYYRKLEENKLFPPEKPKPDVVEIPDKKLAQDLPLKEVFDLLTMDLHKEPDLKSRVTKASALREAGLISSEHYGSLLLKQLTAKDVSKGDQIRSIVELGNTINKLGLEEAVREQAFNDGQKYIALGLTAGLSSADLKRNLAALLPDVKDADVRATAQFTLDFLDKKNIDQLDRTRFNEVFFKADAGITADAYRKQLRDDLNSEPDSASGWDRKIHALEFFMEDALKSGDAQGALDAYKTARDITNDSPSPHYKMEAVKLLLGRTGDGGTRLDGIESLLKSNNISNPEVNTARFLTTAYNLFGNGLHDRNDSVAIREEAALARRELVDLMVPLVRERANPLLKAAFEGQLRTFIDYGKTADPFREVRLAAVRGLNDLNSGNVQENLKLLVKAVDGNFEQSGAVRLETVKAIETMVPNSRDRKKILSEFADKETDLAVIAKLRKYFEPKGSVQDATSQRSRKEVTDRVTEQNRPEVRTDEVEDWLKKNFNQLTKHDNIFKYFNADKQPYRAYQFGGSEYTTTFAGHWEEVKEMATRSWNWAGSIDLTNRVGKEALIAMEGQAQVWSYMNFQSQVDSLYNLATRGGASPSIQMGDQTITQQQAAIFALGNLLREGSRMGDPFFKHRQKYEMDTADPGYGDFSAAQEKIRQEAVTERGYWTRKFQTNFDKNGIAPSTSDPWMKMEVEIANKMKSLVATSPDNLPVLKDQLLAGLKSDKINNDQSRVVMVEALDALVSRPNVELETVQDAVRQVARLVQTTQEVSNNKAKSMVAMLDFLEKHGLTAFEKYSDDYAEVRKAVNTRMSSASIMTPPEVRLRAHEIYERNWQSVLNEIEHRQPTKGSARQKESYLPADLTGLEKVNLNSRLNTRDGSIDEAVFGAVEGIIDATKGDTLKADDPRLAKLKELTDAKYHDRVRLAAGFALLNSETESRSAANTLIDLALNSEVAAYRHDAIKAIEKNNIREFVSEGELLETRNQFINKLADALALESKLSGGKPVDRESLNGKTDAELIKGAVEYMNRNSGKDARPQLRGAGFEVSETLHQFGSSMANLATMQMNMGRDYYSQAETNFNNALNAFGLDNATLDSLSKKFSEHHDPDILYQQPDSPDSPFRKALEQLVSKLQNVDIFDDIKKPDAAKGMANLEMRTNEMPGLITALNKYALLNASMRDGQTGVRMDRTMALLTLSDLAIARAYPEGRSGRGDAYAEIGNAYKALAQSSITSTVKNKDGSVRAVNEFSDRFYRESTEYFQKAAADYARISQFDTRNLDGAGKIERSHNDVIDSQLRRLEWRQNRLGKLKGWELDSQKEQIARLSGEVGTMLSSHPDKESFNYHFAGYRKNFSDAQRQTGEEKATSLKTAERDLMSALKSSAARYGVNSSQYSMSVNELVKFARASGQPKLAEDYFNQGLKEAERSSDSSLKSMMLLGKAIFLHAENRKDEKDQVVVDYHTEKAKQSLLQSGGELTGTMHGDISRVRDILAQHANNLSKRGDFSTARTAMLDCATFDRKLNDGQLSPGVKNFIQTQVNMAETRCVELLKAGKHAELAEPFRTFVDGYRQLNDGALPDDVLSKVRVISESTMQKLGDSLYKPTVDKERFAESEPLLKVLTLSQSAEVQEMARRATGAKSDSGETDSAFELSQAASQLAGTVTKLADGYQQTGQPEQAETLLRTHFEQMMKDAPTSTAAGDLAAGLINTYAAQGKSEKITGLVSSYADSIMAKGNADQVKESLTRIIELSGMKGFVEPVPGTTPHVVSAVLQSFNNNVKNIPADKRTAFLTDVGGAIATSINRRAESQRYHANEEAGAENFGRTALNQAQRDALNQEAAQLEGYRSILNGRLETALVDVYNAVPPAQKIEPLLGLTRVYGQERLNDAMVKVGQHHFSRLVKAGDMNQVFDQLSSVGQELRSSSMPGTALSLTASTAKAIRDSIDLLPADKREEQQAELYPRLIAELADWHKAASQAGGGNERVLDEGMKVLKELSQQAEGPLKAKIEKMLATASTDSDRSRATTQATGGLALMYAYQGKTADARALADSYLKAGLKNGTSIESVLNNLGTICDAVAKDPNSAGLVSDITCGAIKEAELLAAKMDEGQRKSFYESLYRFAEYRTHAFHSNGDGGSKPAQQWTALKPEIERLRKLAYDN